MKSTVDKAENNTPEAYSERLTLLLAGCDQGNEAAFEELYQLCSPQLFGVLMRILGIEAVAEEALQDSFVKIWQKAGSFDPESGGAMSWMFSIARHQALDLLRRRSLREGYERGDLAAMIETTPDLTKPLHEMNDDASILMQCLERLNEKVSNCLVSAYCEGYSHEELAARSGAPAGTVKSWIRRGLISLRECIDELS